MKLVPAFVRKQALKEWSIYRHIWQSRDEVTGRVGHPFIVRLECASDWPEGREVFYEADSNGTNRPVEYVGQGKHSNRFVYAMMMEFCSLGSLQDFINERMQLGFNNADLDSSRQWLEYFRRFSSEILCALDFLHNERSVFYRDLKPDNVFIAGSAEDPHVKLGDFGLSNFFDASSPTSSAVGTNYFAAPEMEQRRFWGLPVVVDLSADVFSFGMVAYVMAHGCAYDDAELSWRGPHQLSEEPDGRVPHPTWHPSGFLQELTALQREAHCPPQAIQLILASTARQRDNRKTARELQQLPFFSSLLFAGGPALPPVDWRGLRMAEL